MSRGAKFVIVRTNAGWHTRLIGGNAQKVLTSEPYTRKRAAYRAIEIAREAFHDAGVTVYEVEEVDERYVPPPVVLEPPFYLKTVRFILDVGTRNARYGPPEDFWHDREYHWHNCDGTTDQGGDCTEQTPPVGTEVHSRGGSARTTP